MTLFFATCPKNLESLLATELLDLGARCVKETRSGVSFESELHEAYKICLWSRLANKIFLPLTHRRVSHVDDLYEIALKFFWRDHMTVDNTFSIDVDLIGTEFKNHQYAIQKFKDGLVDYWRQKTGRRPSVAKDNPDLEFHLLVKRNELTLSLNLSGESLHKRKIRLSQGEAPLKENLAAALLIRAGWPSVFKEGGSLLDPLCGSGTILLEGAMLASDMAPGLMRERFGFSSWLPFQKDQAAWLNDLAEAKKRHAEGLLKLPKMYGCDSDPEVIQAAKQNAERLGLSDKIQFEVQSIEHFKSPGIPKGLILTNPPYGERLGEHAELTALYQALGELFKREFPGWQCSVFTGNVDLAKALKLGPDKIYKFFNGTLACQLLNCIIRPRLETYPC